jgi:very-short-patch-repair endonuclease
VRSMPKKQPYGHWAIKANVLSDARNYNYQAEWKAASPGAWTSAQKHGWLLEASKHMTGGHKSSGYWTKEALIADAQKHQAPSDWKNANASAYGTAIQNGWLDACCEHMVRIRKPEGYWTKEKALESARKFSTIIAWSQVDGPAYDAAKRKNWMKEATRHMVKTYSLGEYTIYSLLLQYGIDFVHQKRFDDLKDKAHLPYDFYLPDFSLVVEYQGRQHFKVSQSSMFRKDLKNMQRRDALKREYPKRAGLFYLEIQAQKVEEIERVLVEKLRQVAEANGREFVLSNRPLNKEEIKTLASLGVWTKEAVLADAKKYQTVREWRKACARRRKAV